MIKKEGSMMGYLFSTSNTKPDDPIISTSLTRNDSIPNPSPLESPRESASTSVAKQGTSPEEKKKPKIKDRESQRVMDIQLPEHIKLPPTSLPPLYFNIVLLNKGEAVEKTIKKKMGMKGGIFSKAMSAAANSVISDKAIIDKLSEQLKTNLESTVSEMGIVAIVSKAFQQGPYLVMKLSVENVNLLGLLWATKGMAFAHNFATLLISVDALGQGATAMPNIINNMLKQVYENLITKCSEMIPEQLEQKGLHVDFLAASKEEQAEEMFRILDALNNK